MKLSRQEERVKRLLGEMLKHHREELPLAIAVDVARTLTFMERREVSSLGREWLDEHFPGRAGRVDDLADMFADIEMRGLPLGTEHVC